MWLIKSEKGQIYYIRGDREVTVGRKETDIILENDKSISKRHCILQVIRDETQGTSRLIAKDAGSKYKSKVILNGESDEVVIGEETELPNLCQIVFGLQDHKFKVQKVTIKICTSQLTSEDSAELERYKKIINAFVFNKWRPDCTHLTTSNPTLTQKVVQALVANLPIVNMSYWRSFMKAIEDKRKLPHPDSYILSMSDTSLKENITLDSQRERMNLFSGLIFLSFSKRQYKHFVDIIEAAGGKIILYDVQNDNTKINVLGKNVIVLQLTTEATQYNDELTNEYMTISKLLNRKKLRIVSETEIPLAVLYCSTEQYCNPSFDFRTLLQPTSNKADKLKNSTVLAPDTQDIGVSKLKKTFVAPRSVAKEDHVIVPETQDLTQPEKQSDSEKTEPRLGLRIEKSKHKKLNPGSAEIIPETEEMQVSTIVSSSNKTQSSKSSYYTGNDVLEMDDWDDVPCSTQKSGTQKSMQVECLTAKNRKVDSLFTDSDNRQLSIWNKKPEVQQNRQKETETASSKKRKRQDEMDSVSDFEEDQETEKDVSIKKQKTDRAESTRKEQTRDLSEQGEVLEFDDWGLDDHNGFKEVQKFGFLLSGQPQIKNEDNNFEIQIEKRSAPVKIKEKRTTVVEPAIASTSGIQTSRKSIPEKPSKRPAVEIITPQTPEKRRRVDDTKNNHSIEQVTRNIENISVGESNFSVVNVNYYSQFNTELPLLRPGNEKSLTRENFLKTFKKVYALPIERVQI